MNIVLIKPEEISADRWVTLTGRRHLHIRDILKSQAGDHLRLGIVNGPMGQATLLESSADRTILGIDTTNTLPPQPATDLILALPRPIMLKRILAQAATMGVGQIYLINANRVEKSFFNASMVKNREFEEHLLLGLEQAMDTRLPQVKVQPRFRPFVEDELPDLMAGYSSCLLAHPGSPLSLPAAAGSTKAGRTLLAVGPEGGWVDFEVELFKAQGFTPFHMGPRIMRVETAVTALLAQLDLLWQMRNDARG